MIDRRIADRYEPIEVVGRGGQATVLKAVDTRHGRLVALKLRDAPNESTEDLLCEARTLLSLPSHPGLAHARDDLFDAGQHVLVLDWVEGADLAALVAERGDPGLPVSSVLRWTAQVAEALSVLHAHGVVHGDVKPANIVVDRDGRAVLVDLGTSSVRDAMQTRGGTPGYRAPEVASGSAPTTASDVYGLAATVFALLTGQPPTGGAPSWGALDADVAERLVAAVRAGLAIDPVRRPPSPGALVERLRAGWDDATPTGVVTVLVTDVVDSAAMWERTPHEAPALLAAMQLTVDRCVETNHGRRSGGTVEGDSTISLFTRAIDAVRAAVDVQRAMGETTTLQIRAAVATGEVVMSDGEAHGSTVNRAVRVRDLARAGEVLLSGTTADVVRAGLPVGIDLLTLGPHPLRGIEEPDSVAAVVADGVAIPPDPMRSPYPGLASFAPSQADLYVGREDVVARCCSLFSEHGFVAIVGASGSGKTSLALAGVVPQLGDARVVRPGADPMDALLRAQVSHDQILVVDQLEELVTLCEDTEARARFAAEVLAHPGGAVVTVRADMYGEFGALEDLAARLVDSQVLLGPMDASDLVRAIEEPARRCGLEVESGLADVIAGELGHAPGALPLLGHALRETWLRREGRTITLTAYRASGGVEHAIASTADRALDGLDDDGREVARQLLVRMVELRRDGDDARRWASRREVTEIEPKRAPDVVAALADARLLVIDGDHVTVVHEALLRAWPTLRHWVSAERADLLAHQDLRIDAERWVAGGRSDADLYRGARLDAALGLASRARLVGQDREFVEAGRTVRDREIAEARRRTRRLRSLAGAATAFAILAATVGIVALVQRNEAQRSRNDAELSAREADEQRAAADVAAREARIEALVGRAGSIRETQRDTAALLAAQAFQFDDTATTRSALFRTFTEGDGFLDTHRLDGVSAPDGGGGIVLPDGETAFIVDASGRLRPYELDTGETGAPLESVGAGDPNPVLAASADGRLLAQVMWAGSLPDVTATIGVFDTTTHSLRFAPVVVDEAFNGATFVDDGQRLALSAYPDAGVVVIDTTSGEVVATKPGTGLPYDPDNPHGVGIAGVGDSLVVATTQPPTLRVLDATTLELQRTIEMPGGFSASVFDVGDGTVVTSALAGIARVDVESGEVLWTREAADACPTAMVDLDRQRLYCGSIFGRLDERDLETGLVVRRLGGQNGNSGLLALADDGGELVSFGINEPVVTRWRLDGSGPITRRMAAGYDPFNFDPAGDRIIVNRGDPTLGSYESRVLDTDTGDLVRDLAPVFGETWTDDDRIGGVALDPETFVAEFVNLDLETGDLEHTGVPLDPLPIGVEGGGGKGRPMLIYPRADGAPGSELRILDVETLEIGPPLVVGPHNSLSVSSDGRRVVVGTADQRGVEIYDTTSGELVDVIPGATQGGFLTATDQLFVTGLGGELTQYDFDTLERVRTFGGSVGYIQVVLGTVDGDLIMTRDGDRSVSVYDVATGVRLGTPITIPDDVYESIALAPNGSRLAVGGVEGVLVWDLDPQRWLEAACEVAGRNLTRAEWETNIGDLAPYAATCPEFPIDP